MPTTLDDNSKPDTVYLALGVTSIATLAEDEGQYRTDLSTGADYAYEDSSERCALDGEWTIEFEFEYDPGESGIVVNHGTADGTSYTYRISVTGSAVLEFRAGGNLLGSIDLDNVSSRSYVVFWALRPDGTTYRSEFGVYDKTDARWTRQSIKHAAITTSNTWRLNLGGYGAGTDVYSYGMDAFEFVRIGARFHSAEEVAGDWIATPSPDTVTAIRRCGTLPVDSSTNLADHGAFAGPSLLVAGAAARENDRRLLSPLLNVKYSGNNELTSAYAPAGMVRKALGSTIYRHRIDMVVWRPVPRNVSRARVRVHADHYQLAGTNLPVQLRMYSYDRLPSLGKVLNEPPPKPIEYYYCGEEIDESSGKANIGIWVDLGELKLARHEAGDIFGTYLALAWVVDEDSADPDVSGQVVRINHVVVEPYAKPLSGGQFGDYGLGVP